MSSESSSGIAHSPLNRLPHELPSVATRREKRELAFGLTLGALSLVALAALALRRPRSFIQKYQWKNRVWVIGSVGGITMLGLAASRAAPIGLRVLAGKLIYPLEGRPCLDQEARDRWEADSIDHVEVVTASRVRINTRRVLGRAGAEHSGEAIVISPGNTTIYEHFRPDEFEPWTEQGYDVIVFHPPGYGDTAGPRTPQGDYQALRAVIEQARRNETSLEQVTLVGGSIGSGAATAVAADLPVGHLVLVVPFGRLTDVIFRGAQNLVGKFIGTFLGKTVRDHIIERYEYDNVENMRGCQASRVSIFWAADDALMTVGEGLTETAKLRKAYLATHTNDSIVDLVAKDVGHSDELFLNIDSAADLLKRACLAHEERIDFADSSSGAVSEETEYDSAETEGTVSTPVKRYKTRGGKAILLRTYSSPLKSNSPGNEPGES